MKINDYLPHSSAIDNDLLPIWDAATSSTKQIKLADLKAYFGSTAPPSATQTQYVTKVLSSNPIAYWKLIEKSGNAIADASTNAITGLSSGSLVLDAYELLISNSKNPQFNGGSIVANSPIIPKANQSRTIDIWWKTALSQNRTGLWGYGANTNNQAFNLRTPDDGDTTLFFWAYANDLSIPLGFSFNDNDTHHVAITYNSSAGTLTAYVDGQMKATKTLGSINTAGDNFYIAKNTAEANFIGYLGHCAINDYALSAAEILSRYNTGKQLT